MMSETSRIATLTDADAAQTTLSENEARTISLKNFGINFSRKFLHQNLECKFLIVQYRSSFQFIRTLTDSNFQKLNDKRVCTVVDAKTLV